MSVLSACRSVHRVSTVLNRGQKKASDPQGQELLTVVSAGWVLGG